MVQFDFKVQDIIKFKYYSYIIRKSDPLIMYFRDLDMNITLYSEFR